MRVLLTGVGGFVGSHLLEAALAETTWDIAAIESFRHNGVAERTLDALDHTHAARVRIHTHDLNAPLSPMLRSRLGQVDCIINVASKCQVDESIRHPAEFIANNVNLVLTMLEYARTAQPRLFIQMSTDEVYGHGAAATGLTPHRPSNPYAASKAAQENICHAYAVTYGLPTVIVNSSNIFGERQSQLAYIPKVLRALTRGQRIPIHTHNGQPGTRTYLYVRNLVAALLALVPADPPTPVRKVHLRGQADLDNLQLANRLANLTGYPLNYDLVEATSVRPGYDPSYDLTPTGVFEWPHTFNDGLTNTVRWAQNNPAWLDI